MTYPNKEIYHEKYIKCQVHLLGGALGPVYTGFYLFSTKKIFYMYTGYLSHANIQSRVSLLVKQGRSNRATVLMVMESTSYCF